MLFWFVIFIFTVLENRKLQAGAYILESLRHMDFGQLMAEVIGLMLSVILFCLFTVIQVIFMRGF
jgi:hypothetical protein